MIERRALLLPAAFLAIAAAAPAPRPDLGTVLTSLDSVKHFHDVAISPDGVRAAWSERVRDAEAREAFGAIFVADVRSGAARRLTAASDGKPHREWGAEFSPDRQTIAFLSDAEKPPQLQIWTAPAAGGPAKQLTRIEGQLAHLHWAPDGRSIACLFVRGSTQETGALVAHARDSGVVGEIVEEQRIAVADLASGAIREVSPHDLYVYDYDWAPDGRSFAAEAAKGSGTNNYWVAELYVVEAGTGHTRSIWKPALQIACPRFAPDGNSVAVIHGIMSDEGSTGGDVWTVPVAGGAPANLTPEMKASATALFWKPSGDLVFSEAVDGEQGVAALEAGTHSLKTLWKGPTWPEKLALARDGSSSAVILESYREAPEAAAGPIGAWKALSHSNAGAKAWWGEAKSLHWKSDGETVQGWLLYPIDFDASKRYPMVVSVHGGPSSDQRLAWPSRWTGAIPSQGYFLFLPNPRGSYGFGETFTQGNVKDFGGGDLRDILSGVDEALKAAPDRPGAPRDHRLELRRIHDDVGGDADESIRRRRRRRGNRRLAQLLRAEQDRHLDAAVLRRLGLRRSGRLRAIVADRVHQEGQDTDARPARRARLRGPDAAGLRVLARIEGAQRRHAARHLSGRGARHPETRASARHRPKECRLVRPVPQRKEVTSQALFDPRILAGRSIVVTGGGSGLGLAMAKAFAAHGAHVTIAGRRRERLEAAEREIAAAAREGGKVAHLPADVREPDEVAALMRFAVSRFGKVDGLVNNAAGNFLALSEKLTPNGFDAVVRTVLYGSVYCTLAVGRHLMERHAPGAIVSILATYAETGTAFALPSACAKAGVLAMTRSLAVEWAPSGIRLNAIAPGPIPTEGAFSRLMAERGSEEERARRASRSAGSGRRKRSQGSRPS